MALPKEERNWPVAEAKNKLSELLDRAQEGEPQHIVRRGRRFVLALETDLNTRETDEPNFLEFLMSIPKFEDGEPLQIPDRSEFRWTPFEYTDDE